LDILQNRETNLLSQEAINAQTEACDTIQPSQINWQEKKEQQEEISINNNFVDYSKTAMIGTGYNVSFSEDRAGNANSSFLSDGNNGYVDFGDNTFSWRGFSVPPARPHS
jgi:capsid portal protein